jgi:hypothetical protein
MGKTERIEFKDTGDWWEFKTYLTVASEREYAQHALDSQATLSNPDPAIMESLARRMDELVVKSTVAWSYGPLTLDTFYDLPAHHYAQVAKRLGDLYSPLVVTAIERAVSNYSLLLNQANQSQ